MTLPEVTPVFISFETVEACDEFRRTHKSDPGVFTVLAKQPQGNKIITAFLLPATADETMERLRKLPGVRHVEKPVERKPSS